MSGAGVIAQTGPGRLHFVLLRAGKGLHIGETRQESLVVPYDGRHLRLLQHDFGQPDPIWIAGVLPGQAVPPRFLLPRYDALRELLNGGNGVEHGQKRVFRVTDQRADSAARMATTTTTRARLDRKSTRLNSSH